MRGWGVLPVAAAEEARLEADWRAVLGTWRMWALRASLCERASHADPNLERER